MPPPPPLGPVEDLLWWLLWLALIAAIVIGAAYIAANILGLTPKTRREKDEQTELMKQLLEEIRSLHDEIKRLRRELEAE